MAETGDLAQAPAQVFTLSQTEPCLTTLPKWPLHPPYPIHAGGVEPHDGGVSQAC